MCVYVCVYVCVHVCMCVYVCECMCVCVNQKKVGFFFLIPVTKKFYVLFSAFIRQEKLLVCI